MPQAPSDACAQLAEHPEVIPLSDGFEREMLAELVLAGFVTVAIETVQAGAPTIKVERYHITDNGRKALNEVMRGPIHHVR